MTLLNSFNKFLTLGEYVVIGTVSGRKYSKEDIFDSYLYPKMKNESLLDDDDCLVVPVRNEGAPHFRRIGNPSFGKRLGRDENNPTHDRCVSRIYDALSKSINSVRFTTYVFGDNGSREEQTIFTPIKHSQYLWFMENECRVAFSDETYIKSDLSGRDSSRFFPRASCPNIIIEVIRTHIPDKKTFQKLFELSKCNHHVYFYFIAEGKTASSLNHLHCEDGALTIRVSRYLIGGKLFINEKECYAQRDSELFEEWYNYLKNSYFLKAMEKVNKE